MEVVSCFFCFLPISSRFGWAGHPYLTNTPWSHLAKARRIHNTDVHICAVHLTTAHKSDCIFRVLVSSIQVFTSNSIVAFHDHLTLAQCLPVHKDDMFSSVADIHTMLCKTVGSTKHVIWKTCILEKEGKIFDCLVFDHARTIQCESQV